MRNVATILTVVLLSLTGPQVRAEEATVKVDVPRGSGIPVITDGDFSPGEWDDSLRIPLNDSVALHFKEHGGVVFVGIRGREPFIVGPSELCIASPGGPIVKLHVSAQLYEVELPAEGKEPAPRFGLTRLWYASEVRRDEPLSKQLMSEGKSPIEMIRASHYPMDGLEFAVRREKFDGNRWLVRFMVSAFIDGKPTAIVWPAGTEERKTERWAELRLGADAVAAAWEREPRGVKSALIGTGQWGGTMLAVGQRGTLLRRSGGIWSPLPSPAEIQFSFAAGDGGALAIDPANPHASAELQRIGQMAEVRNDAVDRQLVEPEDERAVVAKTIRDAIGWALTKDRARLESIMAHDPDFFIFHPDSKSTVRGYESFAKMIPGFMDPRFVATHFETKDLTPVFSRSGDVAWFSAMLDDCGTWLGKESCWKETRWTGVLEKREGRWLIVQMHFSFAKDKVLSDCPKPAPE